MTPPKDEQQPLPVLPDRDTSAAEYDLRIRDGTASNLVINAARWVVPIRHGGYCPQLSFLKKLEQCRVFATMQVVSSTTITPADHSPVPAFFHESKSMGRSS